MEATRHLTSIDDLTAAEVREVIELAATLRIERKANAHRTAFYRQSVAMIFEKPSLRTRVTFETGTNDLGGHAIYLAPADISIGKRESVQDVALNLSRWVHMIVARTFAHSTVTGLAEHATVPVINALSDHEHPCQALAFGQMVLEQRGNFDNEVLAFIGDGNNVAHSMMLLCAKLGVPFILGCPEGYEMDEKVVSQAREIGGDVTISHDPAKAVKDATLIYTDVWASMGQEDETEKRKKLFAPFQVNDDLMSHAPAHAIVTHCLPAHRGEEITDSVLDGPQSRAIEEAENRLHAQKAVMLFLLGCR
jgi:ornithine carbamoyltransferase